MRLKALGVHVSVLGFVSATGKTIHPAIAVEAKSLKKTWVESYPEALWGWDEAGYFAEGPFYSAIENWVKLSEPVGGFAANPRVLYYDSYRSHMDPAVLKLLRAHNVRVVTFHPHTTHLFCVLDTAVFAIFKRVLRDFFEDDAVEISMNNMGTFIKAAWKKCTELHVDAITGETSSPATKGFKSAGLAPFSRAVVESVVEGKHAEIAKLFAGAKVKTAASGVPMLPVAKSIRLTLAEKDAIVADFKKQHLEAAAYAVTPYDATKNRPRKMLSQVATGAEFIAGLEAKQAAAAAEVVAMAQRKKDREALAKQKKDAKDAKAAATAAAKANNAAAAAAKLAAAAELAATKAAAATPTPAPKAAKKPRAEPETGGDAYAKVFPKPKKARKD